MDKNCADTSDAVQNPGCIKEAVCINTDRVYDSCSAKKYTRYEFFR